jgi:predicted RNA-binding Zn ribbon-like protein
MREGSQADEALKQIIALREKLYAIFWSTASSQQVQEQELTWLRQTYLDTLSHARLIKAEGHYIWNWTIRKSNLLSPTWPIIQSSLELLTTEDLTRIKLCPGTPGASLACAWLFYDESKNRSRHWCSMADCGSRTKALRLTARRRIKRKQHEP